MCVAAMFSLQCCNAPAAERPADVNVPLSACVHAHPFCHINHVVDPSDMFCGSEFVVTDFVSFAKRLFV